MPLRIPKSLLENRSLLQGRGDSAVDWALVLHKIAVRVSVVHRRQKFRASPASEQKLKELATAGKIDLAVSFQLKTLKGKEDQPGQLSSVVVCSLQGEIHHIPADCLLSFFGRSMDLGPLKHWDLKLYHDQIVVSPGSCETNLKGIYAVGYVATYPHKLKLILSGFAEAAGAAHAIRARIFPDQSFHFDYSTTSGVPSIETGNV